MCVCVSSLSRSRVLLLPKLSVSNARPKAIRENRNGPRRRPEWTALEQHSRLIAANDRRIMVFSSQSTAIGLTSYNDNNRTTIWPQSKLSTTPRRCSACPPDEWYIWWAICIRRPVATTARIWCRAHRRPDNGTWHWPHPKWLCGIFAATLEIVTWKCIRSAMNFRSNIIWPHDDYVRVHCSTRTPATFCTERREFLFACFAIGNRTKTRIPLSVDSLWGWIHGSSRANRPTRAPISMTRNCSPGKYRTPNDTMCRVS